MMADMPGPAFCSLDGCNMDDDLFTDEGDDLPW